MIESLLDLKESVQESLKRTGNLEMLLGADEWELLGELHKFLKAFKELTDLVSSGNVGLSLIPLIVDELKDAVKPGSDDSPSLAQLKRQIAKNISVRFPVTELVQLCSLLDPSTKDAIDLSQEEKHRILQNLQDTAAELEKSRTTHSEDSVEATEPELQPSSKKRKLLQKIKRESSDDSSANEEITRYLASAPTAEQVDNPLAFWKANEKHFPLLSKLARKYLCVSASSVPVESMFSITGLILNGKRSQLAPCKLNYLTFVHDNYPVFFKV